MNKIAQLWGTFKTKLKGAKKSLTVWFNGVSAALMALLPLLHDSLDSLKEYSSGDLFQHFGLAVVVGNILLRFKTGMDLKDK